MRLELSKRTDLAIRALEVLCSHAHDLVGGAHLASIVGTSTHRLPQVMRPLVINDLVESVPGPNGGYRLSADLLEVSLLKVIEAVEGPIPDDRCVLRGAPCPAPEPCALHFPWTRAREALLSELENTPVSEMRCRARI